jgi:hypothetical protein
MCTKGINSYTFTVGRPTVVFPLTLFIIVSSLLFIREVMASSPPALSRFAGLFDTYNGFDVSRHAIPKDEILSGGPPRDGIPSINNPQFVTVKEAGFMKDNDLVIGIAHNDFLKAYPIKILNWHEVVNDTFGNNPVLVSFCPLCGTAMAFAPVIDERKFTFGVSGLLYQSDLLMYDHQTESLWSQIEGEAVTGDMLGEKLFPLPSVHMTWKAWKAENPKTLVLSTHTGYQRDYDRDPYEGYELSERLYFPVKNLDRRFHPKEKVLGVEVNGVFKAYPFTLLAQAKTPIVDKINGKAFKVFYDAESQKAFVTDENDIVVPSLVSFWFAWYAFHRNTLVYGQ